MKYDVIKISEHSFMPVNSVTRERVNIAKILDEEWERRANEAEQANGRNEKSRKAS